MDFKVPLVVPNPHQLQFAIKKQYIAMAYFNNQQILKTRSWESILVYNRLGAH